MILGLPLLATLQVVLLNSVLALSGYTVIAGGNYSFAFVGFYGIGAYTAAYLATQQGVGTWGEIGAAMALAAVIALVLGRLLVRLGGVYLAMATVAFTAIVGALAVNLGGITGGAAGITGVSPNIGTWWLVISVVALCVGFWLISRSRTGMAMRLVRSDVLLSRAMGVNDVNLGIGLFVVSSMMAAFGGVLYAHYYQFVAPADFSFTLLIDVLAMVIIGGSRHWSGPIVGAVIITTIPAWLSSIGVWAQVINGVIVLIIILFAPDGIVGAISRLVRWVRTKGIPEEGSRPLEPPEPRTRTFGNGAFAWSRGPKEETGVHG